MVYSVKAPELVTRPILAAADSVNQSAPSEPEVMLQGALLAVGMAYSRMAGLALPEDGEAPGVGCAAREVPTLPHAASVDASAIAASDPAFTVVHH
jgi:hypothetical protein